jgi:hypothetical protein
MQVYNLSGRVVYSLEKASGSELNVHTPQLKRGIYLVRINCGKIRQFEKVIVK